MTYRWQRPSRRYGVIGFALLLLLVFCLADGNEDEMLPSAETESGDSSALSAVSAELPMIALYCNDTGETVELSLEDYVVGVVAAEMPCDFEVDALRAQAVVARTYTLWKIKNGDHEKGDLCDAPGHCQAYLGTEELREQWGSGFADAYRRVEDAVYGTAGLVLVYGNELAETYYHSTCGGKTASAAEVWGEDIPYLRSVACDWDGDAPRYRETISVSLDELPWLLGDGASPCIAVARGDDVAHIPYALSETESGRAREVSYAGLIFEATDFRDALGLNSTRFSMTADGDTLCITTYGYGHGVGLCQYGANGLACGGKSFEEILYHYYNGVSLKKIKKSL